MMNSNDPSLAVLRCWEHEDCLEHPELALACADGVANFSRMPAFDDERFAQLWFIDLRGVGHHHDGDGYTGGTTLSAGDGWGCGYYGGREAEYRLYYGTTGGNGSGGDGWDGGQIGGYEIGYGWPEGTEGDGLMPAEDGEEWPAHWGTRLAAPLGIW